MRRPYTYTQQKFKVNFGNILYLSAPQADWNQEDENGPGYIRNKPNLIAGENIVLTKEGNDITISTLGTVVPDEPDTPDVPDVPTPPADPSTPVELIMAKQLPIFVGLEDDVKPIYELLDGQSVDYSEQGFYVVTSEEQIKKAGYQVTFFGNLDGIAQVFLVPKVAKISCGYQYAEMFNTWGLVDFNGGHWLWDGEVTKTINNEEIVYNKYVYNIDLWGDAITSTEYWRFEIEV